MVGDFGGVAVRTGTRWPRSRGNGNAVTNHDRVVDDEDLLDEESHDPLLLQDVERLSRRPQARQTPALRGTDHTQVLRIAVPQGMLDGPFPGLDILPRSRLLCEPHGE